jgi:AcrR family transcriptional regulator
MTARCKRCQDWPVITSKSASSYHHGDLRNALVDAATTLARQGGPDAVVLREAARRIGVTPAAAYHHFANHEQLVQAVKQRALALLTSKMESAFTDDQASRAPAGARGPDSPADAARRRLRALGSAYLRFAFDEPGLFRLAFGPRGAWPTEESARPHDHTAGPLVLLCQVLDELATAGAIPAERQPGLEYVAWAEVHGVASFCLDGPLARMDPGPREQVIGQALDSIVRGLST